MTEINEYDYNFLKNAHKLCNGDDNKKYRITYLTLKSLIVDGKEKELDEIFDEDSLLEYNLRALHDMTLEEDFARSIYKSQLNRAVGYFVMTKRDVTSPYNDEFNELITLNNRNFNSDEDTTKDLLVNELLAREISPRKWKKMIDSFSSFISFDVIVYTVNYLLEGKFDYKHQNRNYRKALDFYIKSSRHKIDHDYLPVDSLPLTLNLTKDE